MAANSFSPTLTNPIDRARYALGDTGNLDANGSPVWLIAQDTLQALLDANGYAEGVAEAADGLVARFSQDPDLYRQESGLQVEWKNRLQAWRDLATRMRTTKPGPDAGRQASPYQVGQLPNDHSLVF